MKHREFVRSELFDAINYPDQNHATMYRDSKWKFISYHGKDLFELYDLENEPWEHNDLSECSDHQFALMHLMQKSFDAAIRATPPDAPRNMPLLALKHFKKMIISTNFPLMRMNLPPKIGIK